MNPGELFTPEARRAFAGERLIPKWAAGRADVSVEWDTLRERVEVWALRGPLGLGLIAARENVSARDIIAAWDRERAAGVHDRLTEAVVYALGRIGVFPWERRTRTIVRRNGTRKWAPYLAMRTGAR